MKITDEEWGAAKKLLDYWLKWLEQAASAPESTSAATVHSCIEAIKALNWFLEAGHRPS